jgi:hypothetical protein
MDELADRPERGNISATLTAARLQSLVEILPDGSPTTTSIGHAARKLRTHPAWRGPLGQRLGLDYMEKTIGKLVKAHPDLIKSKLKVSLRGVLELRIWRQRSDRPVPNRWHRVASRRPGPSSSTPNPSGSKDAHGQVGWFYFRDHPETARHAGVLLKDEARRMAVNFARLPELLGKADPQ